MRTRVRFIAFLRGVSGHGVLADPGAVGDEARRRRGSPRARVWPGICRACRGRCRSGCASGCAAVAARTRRRRRSRRPSAMHANRIRARNPSSRRKHPPRTDQGGAPERWAAAATGNPVGGWRCCRGSNLAEGPASWGSDLLLTWIIQGGLWHSRWPPRDGLALGLLRLCPRRFGWQSLPPASGGSDCRLQVTRKSRWLRARPLASVATCTGPAPVLPFAS
jgi:hypothetical protein